MKTLVTNLCLILTVASGCTIRKKGGVAPREAIPYQEDKVAEEVLPSKTQASIKSLDLKTLVLANSKILGRDSELAEATASCIDEKLSEVSIKGRGATFEIEETLDISDCLPASAAGNFTKLQTLHYAFQCQGADFADLDGVRLVDVDDFEAELARRCPSQVATLHAELALGFQAPVGELEEDVSDKAPAGMATVGQILKTGKLAGCLIKIDNERLVMGPDCGFQELVRVSGGHKAIDVLPSSATAAEILGVLAGEERDDLEVNAEADEELEPSAQTLIGEWIQK